MVANPQILKKKKKKTKTQYTRPPIHQVKQKLKLETEKPNQKKKKKKNLISHQRPTDGTFASNLSNRAHQSSPVGLEIGHRS